MPREILNFQREENESISLSFFSLDEEVISIRASVAGLDNTEESYIEENVSDGSATLYSKDGEFPTPAVLRDVVASSVARHPWTDTRVALNIRNDYSQRERRHLAAILQEDLSLIHILVDQNLQAIDAFFIIDNSIDIDRNLVYEQKRNLRIQVML